LVLPSGRVIALGTPATFLGPSAYSSVLAFNSSIISGSGCSSAVVELTSVSLFGGVVTASSVQARAGRGSATGLAIDGSPVAAGAGAKLSVDGWGQVTLGATLGRVTAPVVLRLLQAHAGLPAGTAVVLAFAASGPTVATAGSKEGRKGAAGSGKTRSTAKGQQSQKPAPVFRASGAPFLLRSLPKAARKNPVVALAMRYLGVPYQWGGATPATGFDCSGLVMYVFGKLGVSLPHFAASQWYSPDGVWVKPSRLQPGDLVFFIGSDGTRKEPGHVGIYVDNGYIIDAPHTGADVRIDNLNDPRLADQYVGAKRITTKELAARELFQSARLEQSDAGLFPYPAAHGVAPLSEPLELVSAETHALRPWSLAPQTWTGLALGAAILLFVAGGRVRRRVFTT
jgi:cell wall-associated NlpC family hydrolase